MDIIEYLKLCLVKRGLNLSKLATLTGQSQPNLCNKMKRGNFQLSELEKIAQALDASLEIKFIDNQTSQPII